MDHQEEDDWVGEDYQRPHNDLSNDLQPSTTAATTAAIADIRFHPSSSVKGIRFGLQHLVIRSFTACRSTPLELLRLLGLPASTPPFPTVCSYLPTGFTILAHRAWNTLTLGLGTKNSKVVVFVFETPAMRQAADRLWPAVVAFGDIHRKMIRKFPDSEMARFKFRKGALTFYVYAVRRAGAAGFARVEDLRAVLEAISRLREFLDHTAMLAMPSQRSIAFPGEAAIAGGELLD